MRGGGYLVMLYVVLSPTHVSVRHRFYVAFMTSSHVAKPESGGHKHRDTWADPVSFLGNNFTCRPTYCFTAILY